MKATTIDIPAVIATVTDEQIDRATRIIDMETMHPYYLCLSESDNQTEYRVSAIRKDGHYYFTCTCPAGLRGFSNCKAGYCKHVAWSVAASEEYKQLIKAQAQADARQAAQTVPAPVVKVEYVTNVDAETLARIARRDAERKPTSKRVAYCQTRPAGFSLMR